MSMWYVYVLESQGQHGEIYVGSTNDLRRRFREHNDGKSPSTDRYRPWMLVYYEAYRTEELARLREHRLKHNGNAIRELKKRIGVGVLGLPSTTFSARKSGAGFTLMELLVALGVFAITVGILADLFLVASRRQAETVAAAEIQGEARIIFERIAREMREGSVDYASLTKMPGALPLRDADGAFIAFRRSTDSTECGGASSCLRIGRGADEATAVWAPMTSDDVAIDEFSLSIQPKDDPFKWDALTGAYKSNVQPYITVHLRLSRPAPGGRPGWLAIAEAQTTVVSRVYRR
ncbi:MAG: GIY-YIG nuclease family protein [Candidatus Uhrbacteria bacterium]